MGNFIHAYCKNCDFKSEFNFGGDRINYRYTQNIPAISKLTNEFVVVNALDKSINLDDFILYNDENLQSSHCVKTIQSFKYVLKTDNNICPKCRFRAMFFDVKFYTD